MSWKPAMWWKVAHRCFQILLAGLISLLLLETVLQVGARYMQQQNIQATQALPNAVKRVLFLGDSHTFGLYLPEAESYPRQLERLWATDGAQPLTDFINLGYPGTNSSRIRKSLPDILETMKPDVIVVLVGINDFWTAPVAIDEREEATTNITDWLYQHSRAFQLVYMLQKQAVNKSLLQVDQLPRQYRFSEENNARFIDAVRNNRPRQQSDKDNDINSAVQFGSRHFEIGVQFDASKKNRPMLALRNNLQAIVDIAIRKHVQVLLLTYMNNKDLFISVNQQYRNLPNLASAELLDLSSFHQEHCPPTGPCDAYFFPDLHPNAAGYHELSVRVLPVLRRMLATP